MFSGISELYGISELAYSEDVEVLGGTSVL